MAVILFGICKRPTQPAYSAKAAASCDHLLVNQITLIKFAALLHKFYAHHHYAS